MVNIIMIIILKIFSTIFFFKYFDKVIKNIPIKSIATTLLLPVVIINKKKKY